MKAIKVILKWIGIVAALFFLMTVGIVVVAKYNTRIDHEKYIPAKNLTETAWNQNFDIEKHCREVSQFAGGSYQIEQGCRNNERTAKEQLDAESIPPEIKKHCADVAEFAGGSYQIMMGCVKNEIKAKANLQ